MSNLSIGLVTSPSEESKQLISLIEALGVEVTYHISPEEITSSHIENQSLNVWLLNVDDDHWHDNIDQLLDESDASIYFNEPGTLTKQSHPEFWCEKLVNRLYELTGISKDDVSQSDSSKPEITKAETVNSPLAGRSDLPAMDNKKSEGSALESADDLSSALDELEISSVGLPSDIAADLVSELESISPALEAEVSQFDIGSANSDSLTQEEPSILVDEETTPDLELSLEDDLSFDEDFALEDLEPDPLEEKEQIDEVNDLEQEQLIEQETSEVVSEIMELVDEEMQEDSMDLDDELDFDSFSLDSIDDISELDETLLVDDTLLIGETEQEKDPREKAEQIASTEQKESSVEEATSSLSLEDIDIKQPSKITGRAQYVIDDQPRKSELESPALEAQEEPSQIDAFAVDEDDTEGLSLEAIEESSDTEPDSFTSDAQNYVDDDLRKLSEQTAPDEMMLDDEFILDDNLLAEESDIEELTEQPIDRDVNAEPEPVIEHELAIDQELNIEQDAPQDNLPEQEATATLELEEFEIPMLEEAATGLDFEQVTEYPSDELTPCWVIGASLGGPAAVKRFLQSLPADINASFIVVQHIDENFLPVLADILTSNSHFDVEVATGSNSISAGKVYLAPLKGKLVFLKDGSMLVDRAQKWSPPYMPCIDDVIESLAGIYGDKSGAIIFSGMGHDGLEGVKKMKSVDGQVWAQSVETCANSSMPESVINEGLASVVAAPEMLADRLVDYIGQKIVVSA